MAKRDRYEAEFQKLWWEETDPEKAGELMQSVAEEIEEAQKSRREMELRHMRLYFNRDLSSVYECGIASNLYDGGVYLTMNVGQSCVDTLTAKTTRSKPRVAFLTEKGNHSLKQRAKKLSSFNDGVLHANKMHTGCGRQAFVDALLCGSGVIHGYGDPDRGEVMLERVIPGEMLADETEAMYGLDSLFTLYRKKYVHREVLLRMCKTKEQRDAVRRADGAVKPGLTRYRGGAGNMIPVYVGWRLPSGPGKDDGRYLMRIQGATLAARPWTRMRFPFSFLHFNYAGAGLWGRSLMEQLVPVQLKINDLLEQIDQGERDMCTSKVLVPDGCMNLDAWSNAQSELIPYQSTLGKPEVIQGRGVSKELYDSLGGWWRHGFEVTGISMLSATAEKPQGITSAVALRELLDREDMRHAPIGQGWEEFFVDTAELSIDTADELYEKTKKLIVQVPGKDFIRSIDWKEVNLDRDRYVKVPEPTSTLPTTPAGRREHALEMFKEGAIDRARFFQLAELPDTGSTISLITASIEYTEMLIEEMLEHGRYEPPEEYMDLTLSKAMVMQSYLRARIDKAPDKRLELLRRWIDEAEEMIQAREAEMAPAQQKAALGGDPAAAAVVDPMAGAGTPDMLSADPGAELDPALTEGPPPGEVDPAALGPEAGFVPEPVEALPPVDQPVPGATL